jgi:hypothetical protein
LTPERTGRTNAAGTRQRRPSRSPLPTYRSANDIMPDPDSSDRLPEALRPSASLAKLDLYVAPYESRPSALSPSASRGNAPYDEFGAESRRRESFPPAIEHRQRPFAPGTTSQHSSSQGFHRIPSTSLADDMSMLSPQSGSSFSSNSGRPLPQATGASSVTRPAFYEPSYPSFTSSSSISSHQSQPTGASNFYTPRTSPSPMPQPASSGFVSPERADYQYNTAYGRTSVSPGHTGPGGYFSQGSQPVYAHRTSDAALYPPPQAVTPIPVQPTYTQTPPASLSRDNSFSSQYSSPHHQQSLLPLQQPQQTPYAPSTSPHSQPNIPSSYSAQAPYDYAPQPQPTPMPYQTPHNHRNSLPPPPSSNSVPYVPPTTPQPQTHYGNGQFGTSPSIPYLSQQQPLEAIAPPPSHSAPPGPQYDHGGPGGPAYPTSTLPSPTGHRHGPRTSSSGSGSGRPLPDPQQHGHAHAHSQSNTPHKLSQSFGFSSAPTSNVPSLASGQFHQSASFTTQATPVNGGLTPAPPSAPSQTQVPPPPQQPISAYEQFQQMQYQQHNPISPQTEPGYTNSGPVPQPQRSQSLPPAPPAPAYPNIVPEQPVYNQQHQQQPTYPTYSSVYPFVPPPPPLPSSVSSIIPPPPPPLPPTTPPYQYQQTLQPGSYSPQPPSTYVSFSPPPPPPPLHS